MDRGMSGSFGFCSTNTLVRSNRKHLSAALGSAVNPVATSDFDTNTNANAKGKNHIFVSAVNPVVTVDFNNTR